MAFRHGKDTYFMLDGTDLTLRLDEVTMSDEIETAESTVFGQGAKTYQPGLEDATISFSGKYQDDVEVLYGQIKAKQRLGTLIPWVFGPEGSGASRRRRTGEGVVGSLEISNPVGDIVSFSGEIQVSGVVTYDQFPA